MSEGIYVKDLIQCFVPTKSLRNDEYSFLNLML